MTTTVRSEQLSEQLRDLDNRIRRVSDKLLVSNLSVDDGLSLQREHSDLTAYRTRLQNQLTAALAQEAQAKKDREEAVLDAELADLRLTYSQATSQRHATLNQIALDLIPKAKEDAKALDERQSLTARYERVFYDRHGKYPSGYYDRLQAKPEVELTKEGETAEFALQLLQSLTDGYGLTLDEVHRRVR